MERDQRSRHCQRCIYAGRVQGVGFRYTSVSIARRYAVTGYVKNLADGTVELVVEAERQPLEEFLSEIEQYFSEKIVECNCTDWGSNASFQDFAVRY